MPESDNRSYVPQDEGYDQVPFPAASDAFAHEQATQPSDNPAFFNANEPAAPSTYSPFGAPADAPKKGRRGLWITLTSLLAVLLLSVAAVSTYLYINRSTPGKTLDSFCKALQQGNYQQAYGAFSKKFQGALTE